MTQITDHATLRNVKVELSADGSTWIDFSGEANSVEPGGGNANPRVLYPLLASKPVLAATPADPVTLDIKVVWREALNSATALAMAAYEQQFPIYARYSPTGSGTSYQTGPAFVTKPPYPGGNVESGKPLLIELKLRTSKMVSS